MKFILEDIIQLRKMVSIMMIHVVSSLSINVSPTVIIINYLSLQMRMVVIGAVGYVQTIVTPQKTMHRLMMKRMEQASEHVQKALKHV